MDAGLQQGPLICFDVYYKLILNLSEVSVMICFGLKKIGL
jgi:hypothetical protein